MAEELWEDGGQEALDEAYAREGMDNEFNLAVLACIPKKPIESDEIYGDVYDAESTRPLMVVNMENRIIAAAYKRQWEAVAGPGVSAMQKGFIPNRSMLSNVVELEQAAMRASLDSDQAALILLDFRAAFPSIEHGFLLGVLRKMGLPKGAMNMLNTLYRHGKCCITTADGLQDGFDITTGIRQGCPLSPLLFAMTMDMLLHTLQNRLRAGSTIRAFADDVGLVCQSAQEEMPIIEEVLKDWERVTGMEINIKKCVCIPLWREPKELVKDRIAQWVPKWEEMPVEDCATYLGCSIGPGKMEQSWSRAIKKFRARVGAWNWSEVGLFFASAAYNTYVLSTMGFTAQITEVDERARMAEAEALRRAAPGPGNWVSVEDLHGLKRQWGLPGAFGSLDQMAKAAQLRVCTWEDGAKGGLQIDDKCRELEQALADTEHMDRKVNWQGWYHHNIPNILLRNRERLRAMGITAEKVIKELTRGEPRPWTEQTAKKAKRLFQRKVREMVAEKESPDVIARTRERLQRWNIDIPERTLAERFVRRMKRLGTLVAPRVGAAAYGTAWNRWCTHRRWQNRGSSSNRCMLGCLGRAEDSIEHYCRCETVREVHRTQLQIYEEYLLPEWIGVSARSVDDRHLSLAAIGAYATYRATNAARAAGGFTWEEAREALKQACVEAVTGHGKTTKLLDNLWLPEEAENSGKKRRVGATRS